MLYSEIILHVETLNSRYLTGKQRIIRNVDNGRGYICSILRITRVIFYHSEEGGRRTSCWHLTAGGTINHGLYVESIFLNLLSFENKLLLIYLTRDVRHLPLNNKVELRTWCNTRRYSTPSLT